MIKKLAAAAWLAGIGSPLFAGNLTVDYRYSPPQWQAAICLPDDPQKTLVDKSGELLYHYHQGREFGTRVSVVIDDAARWVKQDLVSPRVPVVRTRREAPGLTILEEAFAVTDLPEVARRPEKAPAVLERNDPGVVQGAWAKPPAGLTPALRSIFLHNNGAIRCTVKARPGARFLAALALCEGWWDQPGKRVQVLQVEGAPPRKVDTVADIGKNRAAAFWFDAEDSDRDGKIEITVAASGEAQDKNTILNALWIFPEGTEKDDASLLRGALDGKALARLSETHPSGPPRNDAILVSVTNTGDQPRTIHPRLVVDSTLGFSRAPGGQRCVVGGHDTVTSSLKIGAAAQEQATRRSLDLQAIELSPGDTARFHVLYSSGGSILVWPATLKDALAAREKAEAYWKNEAPLPFGRIQVPDPQIQALLDAAVRNIWQAREIKRGLPAFQVGPTCYRGLWIVDGAFLLEAAAILGAGAEARAGVEYELSHQKPSGAFEVLSPTYYKENGIVLWTCIRHARLTRDKAWLQSVWPRLEKTVAYIETLRKRSLENDTVLDDGLLPPGEIDGGLSGNGKPEYTNTYWCLLGLKAAVRAARWLGKDSEADSWREEYDDFVKAFRKAARRDLRKGPHGNEYLPTRMANYGNELPQRAQWAFCHAVYPGQVFEKDDPFVIHNLEMLRATECEEGMVYGTGWDATGIWNYFASFYGHAWLWEGNGRKAAEILYAFANHAAPVLDWREEQSLKGRPYRKVGDMPHNWASAEFIRLAAHLLALDRGSELHLFEGLPAEWCAPGKTTALQGLATPFGPLTASLTVSAGGRSARLHVAPLPEASCTKITVHLGGWASDDAEAVIELDPRRDHQRTVPMTRTPQ